MIVTDFESAQRVRAHDLASKADAWADRMAHDRRAVIRLLREKRDRLSLRKVTIQDMVGDSLKASLIATIDAAIALLEAAEDRL